MSEESRPPYQNHFQDHQSTKGGGHVLLEVKRAPKREKTSIFMIFTNIGVYIILDVFSRCSALGPLYTDRADETVHNPGLRMSGEGPES